ncbi:hypothetical protein B0T16DRAFT_116035 [Cercophora newfieldiana]|uniref:Uncharacterized protein n=1 Tax=Cercophora newfieldiana TaxID=92897 RepID=A0AA39Y9F8_9PEZI|nr:hypothetical protein B0T16DRAFT_116035 [Cercophora newfieldiana]
MPCGIPARAGVSNFPAFQLPRSTSNCPSSGPDFVSASALSSRPFATQGIVGAPLWKRSWLSRSTFSALFTAHMAASSSESWCHPPLKLGAISMFLPYGGQLTASTQAWRTSMSFEVCRRATRIRLSPRGICVLPFHLERHGCAHTSSTIGMPLMNVHRAKNINRVDFSDGIVEEVFWCLRTAILVVAHLDILVVAPLFAVFLPQFVSRFWAVADESSVQGLRVPTPIS